MWAKNVIVRRAGKELQALIEGGIDKDVIIEDELVRKILDTVQGQDQAPTGSASRPSEPAPGSL